MLRCVNIFGIVPSHCGRESRIPRDGKARDNEMHVSCTFARYPKSHLKSEPNHQTETVYDLIVPKEIVISTNERSEPLGEEQLDMFEIYDLFY